MNGGFLAQLVLTALMSARSAIPLGASQELGADQFQGDRLK